jgi:2-phosphosulfolactate phosphatase
MDITIRQGHDPALEPAQLNIVIDVLRAFTTTHVAFERGAREILLAETVDEAFALGERDPDARVAGERNARKIDGFDFGNSPAVMRGATLADRRLVLTTSNGVRATLNALDADAVLVTGWSNVPATLRFAERLPLDSERPPRINLLASHPVSDEDVACADYLAAALRDGERPDPTAIRDRIRTASSAMKFYSTQFHTRDLDVACRQLDSGYAMVVETEDNTPRIVRSSV